MTKLTNPKKQSSQVCYVT